MSGLVGVPCSDTGRYSAFSESLSNLRKPAGVEVRLAVSAWRHKARNELVRWMLEGDGKWLLMIDDDHTFPPDLLERLLAHEVDIVAGLCLQRSKPHGPFCFTERAWDGVYETIDLREHEPVLTKVEAVGTGVMLIRRRVFEVLPEPWFTISPTSGEDMLFCDAARAAGIDVHCDLGCPIGHLTTTVVTPARTSQGEWKVGFIVSDETRVLRELPSPGLLGA